MIECQTQKAGWLDRIEYLRDAPRAFVVNLCGLMGSRLYVPQENVLHTGVHLFVVLRGICSRMGSIMTPGKSWGEDFILNHPSLKDTRSVLALTYTELLVLERPDLFALLADAPEMAERVRKTVVRLTFRRAMFEVARALKYNNALALDVLLSAGLSSGQKKKRRSSYIALMESANAADGKAALAAHMAMVSSEDGAHRASGDRPKHALADARPWTIASVGRGYVVPPLPWYAATSTYVRTRIIPLLCLRSMCVWWLARRSAQADFFFFFFLPILGHYEREATTAQPVKSCVCLTKVPHRRRRSPRDRRRRHPRRRRP